MRSKSVYSYDEVRGLGLPFLVAVSGDAALDIEAMLTADKQQVYKVTELGDWLNLDPVAFNREYCAAFHVNCMDDYFLSAESEEKMDIFWVIWNAITIRPCSAMTQWYILT